MFEVLRVIHYRYKFLTSERYDNIFITKGLRIIDLHRAKNKKETILPLNHRERSVYISVSSLRLGKQEKLKLSQSAVALLIASIKLSTHLIADYSLYWVLNLIRNHGRFQSKPTEPNVPTLNIQGEGLLADLLRSIVKAFQPIGIRLEIDTIPCLPEPIPPDYDRYVQIVSLLILCWFLTIFEPYGLRFRHSVMCFYHPIRARERSIWLYNHIIRSRTSFLKFARRQLKKRNLNNKHISTITFTEYLNANLKCEWLKWCIGVKKQVACFLCGTVFRDSEIIKPIYCQTPKCPGTYCEQCFNDLQNICTICLNSIQYGDLTDISEEKDSSSDDNSVSAKYKKIAKKSTSTKSGRDSEIRTDDTSSDSENDVNKEASHTRHDQTVVYHNICTSLPIMEYDYSYQDNKNVNWVTNYIGCERFSDKEKQSQPEYVSTMCLHELKGYYNTSDHSELCNFGFGNKQDIIKFENIPNNKIKTAYFELNEIECATISSTTDQSVILYSVPHLDLSVLDEEYQFSRTCQNQQSSIKLRSSNFPVQFHYESE